MSLESALPVPSVRCDLHDGLGRLLYSGHIFTRDDTCVFSQLTSVSFVVNMTVLYVMKHFNLRAHTTGEEECLHVQETQWQNGRVLVELREGSAWSRLRPLEFLA